MKGSDYVKEMEQEIKSLKLELFHETHSKNVARRSAKQMYDKLQVFIDKNDEVKNLAIDKRLQNITTFYLEGDEIYLKGKDECDQDFSVCFNAFEFLTWINTSEIDYIKEKLVIHIKNNF